MESKIIRSTIPNSMESTKKSSPDVSASSSDHSKNHENSPIPLSSSSSQKSVDTSKCVMRGDDRDEGLCRATGCTVHSDNGCQECTQNHEMKDGHLPNGLVPHLPSAESTSIGLHAVEKLSVGESSDVLKCQDCSSSCDRKNISPKPCASGDLPDFIDSVKGLHILEVETDINVEKNKDADERTESNKMQECEEENASKIGGPECNTEDSTEAVASIKEKDIYLGIRYEVYESEKQMPSIMTLITKDLSEPYSIYTYRYFIHNWPKLCFLAMDENHCVGAIVCKLDMHKNMVRRGYIAMLAVDEKYRRRKIGSHLVLKAIRAMVKDECDEVVLETEITNKPALKLYENLGFVRDKRLFRYYLNGVDALRLKLWLR